MKKSVKLNRRVSLAKSVIAYNDSALITSQELAKRWKVNEGSIRMMRIDQRGPPYLKLGKGPRPRIRYVMAQVIEWENSNHGTR
jgi:hypothetical protein